MPPNESAACLYQGHVMHMRLIPFAHKFRYRVFSLLLDIDRAEDTLGKTRLLRFERRGLMGFWRRDHGPRDGSDLRPWVEARLAEAGHPRPERIWLLSFPRIFGYGFNPLSVYYCEGPDGTLQSVLYEVKNTFGDQHAYVLSTERDPDGAVRHRQEKGFFVSPFIAMDQVYSFTIRPPAERLALRIRQGDGRGTYLIAAQNGVRRPLTDRELFKQWASHPLMSIKVIAAIHWQALKIWLKGGRFHRYRGPYPQS